jgi:hypothetical protein
MATNGIKSSLKNGALNAVNGTIHANGLANGDGSKERKQVINDEKQFTYVSFLIVSPLVFYLVMPSALCRRRRRLTMNAIIQAGPHQADHTMGSTRRRI